MSEQTKEAFNEWAKVELMGHSVIVGRVSEASMAGGTFLRVDVPAIGPLPGYTKLFNPSAIYGITPVTEAVAMALLDHYRPEPVSRYEMPQLSEKVQPPEPDNEIF